MHVAYSPAPALRWTLALVLFAALGTSAQAQNRQTLAGAPAEAITPNTHFHADGTMQPGARCATPNATEEQLAALHAAAEAFLANHPVPESGTVTIPVAFHVVRQGTGTSNGDIPDLWITNQIQVMNDSFDGTQGGYNTSFRFVLDRTDRTTNAAWYTGCYGSQELPMKQALHYSPATHLNIYSCRPSGGILGYAVFPWSYVESDYRHGVVILDQSMPGGNAFPYNLGGTATHEVGHYLGLWHTFQGGCGGGDTPPGCTTGGDQVCDTAAEASPAFGCPIGRNTCGTGGPDPIHNYMDYTDDACYEEFTEGQNTRMEQMVAQYRPTIWNTKGGSCAVAYQGAVTGTATGGGGTPRRVTFTGTVNNSGATSRQVSFTLNYNRNGGPPQGSRRFGPFNYGPGATNFSLNVPVPVNAPSGAYNWELVLEDKTTAPPQECGVQSGQVTLPPARVAGAGEASVDLLADAYMESFPVGSSTASAVTAPATTVTVAPNPFERQTAIRFEVAEATAARLAVYDVLGREVAVLVDGQVEAGSHTAVFDASALAAGTYVYRLVAGSDVQTGRLMVAR
jgi:hypothetical protein